MAERLGTDSSRLRILSVDSKMPMPSAVQRVSIGVAPRVPAAAPDEVQVYSREAGYVVAVVGRYVVMVVRDQITNTTLSVLRRAIVDVGERSPCFGFLSVLEPGCRLLLPAEIRAGMANMIMRQTHRCAGGAIVYEATGFHATALRSVVTAINFASRATHPTHVCADLPEGVSWLNERTGGSPTAARLLQVSRQLRQVP